MSTTRNMCGRTCHMLTVTITIVLIALWIGGCAASMANARKASTKAGQDYAKQFLTDPESRETDPPNFVRLVIMRLIYGIAAQMGVEDRLAGVLNGIFVPPNADDDDYGGGFGDALGDFGGADDLFDF